MVVYIYIYLDWNYYNGNKEIKLIFKSLVLMYILVCNFCFLFYFLICGCWDVSDWGDGDFVGIVFIDKKLGV